MMVGDSSKNESLVNIIDLTEENLDPGKLCENVSLVSNKKDEQQFEMEKKTIDVLHGNKYRKLFRRSEIPHFYTAPISNENELLQIFPSKHGRGSEIKLCSVETKNIYTEILEDRIWNYMKITEAVPEVVVVEDCVTDNYPQLTSKMQQMVTSALGSGPQSEVLVDAFNLKITRHDISTLKIKHWLNCQVINFYMSLLSERGKENGYPSVYTFNTFFYPRLLSSGFSALRRWTRKVDLFAYDILIVPVHLDIHWCVVTINFKEKTICYYDSMNTSNEVCLRLLWDYLNCESRDKKNKEFNYDGWKTKNAKDIPQQVNASDCGVFSCAYAEHICRNASFNFSQEDMPYFRQKMIYEILSKKLS